MQYLDALRRFLWKPMVTKIDNTPPYIEQYGKLINSSMDFTYENKVNAIIIHKHIAPISEVTQMRLFAFFVCVFFYSNNYVWKYTGSHLTLMYQSFFKIIQMNNRYELVVPSDAIGWHRRRSTLVQVMACCLPAPSHYLNQSRLIIYKVQRQSFQGDFTRDALAANN